jgi:hypothetical protein
VNKDREKFKLIEGVRNSSIEEARTESPVLGGGIADFIQEHHPVGLKVPTWDGKSVVRSHRPRSAKAL